MLCSTTQQMLHTLNWKHITAGTQTDDLAVSTFLSFFFLENFSPLPSYNLQDNFTFKHHCTPLQCFYKGSIQSYQQLALNWLMHSTQCDSTIFPYKELENRLAHETSLCGMTLHTIKIQGTEHSLYIQNQSILKLHCSLSSHKHARTHIHTHTHTQIKNIYIYIYILNLCCNKTQN
jgi:hypothetical protein